tara:strand:- start:218 stop:1237 length:1020 start_codon:yes stop_codon:yes gene_type:complete
MPVKSRNSNDYLSRDVILGKISEYDIFRYYCIPFKEMDAKFCSELREDKTPTVSIIKWNERLLYKDFGCEEHSFDCFSYIQYKYNIQFFDCLRVIDNDFNLKLAHTKEIIEFTRGWIGYIYNKTVEDKQIVIIKKKKRKWNLDDKNFWSKYSITKDILCIFGVEPLDYYWVNYNRFKCNSITYAYKIGDKYKIYAPYSDVKWTSNTTKRHVQGYKQLPDAWGLLIITSSLKDVMCLYQMGYYAIALQSEMQMPDKKLIEELNERFEQIMILYDNDLKEPNPGQVMASKICNTYRFKNLCIPDEYKCKDISDLIKEHGIETASNLLKILINEKISKEGQK